MSGDMLKRVEIAAGCEVRETEYPGYYISRDGFVYSAARRSVKRIVRDTRYRSVIWVDPKQIGVSTLHLVYRAFVAPIPKRASVRIIDPEKDISPENLTIGKIGKLSLDDILEIRNRHLLGFSLGDLAKHWKVSPKTIGNVVTRRVATHIPPHCPICDQELPPGRLYCSDEHKKKTQSARNYRRYRAVRLYQTRVRKSLSLNNLYLTRKNVEAILGVSRARVGQLVALGKLSESDLGIPAAEVRARELQFGHFQEEG